MPGHTEAEKEKKKTQSSHNTGHDVVTNRLKKRKVMGRTMHNSLHG